MFKFNKETVIKIIDYILNALLDVFILYSMYQAFLVDFFGREMKMYQAVAIVGLIRLLVRREKSIDS